MTKKYKLLLFLVFLLVFLGGIFGGYLGYRQRREIQELENNIIKQKKERALELGQDRTRKKIEDPRVETVNLFVAGDMMFHMPQVKGAYKNGDYDFKNSFRHIKDIVSTGDLALANLETTTAGWENGYSGYPRFNSPNQVVRDIGYAGFDILNLNNNHSLDMGRSGLMATIDNLNNNDMGYVGSNYQGRDKHIIAEVKGVRLGIISYSYGYNGMEASYSREELDSMVNKIDEEKIKRHIDGLKNKVDFVLVYIHWGDEYKINPNSKQVDLANKIFAWGGDIILGSHPHVVQRGEKLSLDGKDKYVIYSMGNLISNQSYKSTKSNYVKDGLIVNILLEKDFSQNKTKIKEVNYIPTWTYKYSLNGRVNHEIVPIEKALSGEIEIYNKDAMELELKNSYNRTMDIINKN